MRDYLRPNLWTNTPDILPEYLQYGGRAAFLVRLVLAATFGGKLRHIRPGLRVDGEACREAGSEEYFDSEKYEIRQWDIESPGSFEDFIRRMNRIRVKIRPSSRNGNLQFHPIDNEQLICYSRRSPDRQNTVLVVVNLDSEPRPIRLAETPGDESASRINPTRSTTCSAARNFGKARD